MCMIRLCVIATFMTSLLLPITLQVSSGMTYIGLAYLSLSIIIIIIIIINYIYL